MHYLSRLAGLALFVVLLAVPLLAQDQGLRDTVYFGDNGHAFAFPGNVYRVPIFFASDQEISAASINMVFGLTLAGQTFDSISYMGTPFMAGPYFDLFNGFKYKLISTNGVNPDTLQLMGVALSTATSIPAGRHKVLDVFFHGASLGQQVTVDSAYVGPGGPFVVIGPMASDTYVPEFVGGALTIVSNTPEFYVTSPAHVTVDAASQITFLASVIASYMPVTILLDSMVYVPDGAHMLNLPPSYDNNPLRVVWTPTYGQFGDWKAHFTANDSQGNFFHFYVIVTVNYVEPPCNALHGDANCDQNITISDVVFLIAYIFQQGAPPGCNNK